MGLPPYPEILLAKENYIEKINVDLLEVNSNLVRRSLVSKEETYDNVGDVSINALFRSNNEKDFYEWSTNLLGIYQLQHLGFIKKNDLPFQKGCSLESCNAIREYAYFDNCTPIYLKLNLLHKSDFPYTKDQCDYKGTIYIEHIPTICNYWHFQVKINDKDESKIINKNPSTWKVDAAKFFYKTRLKKYCKSAPSPENPPIINTAIYLVQNGGSSN